MIIKQVVVKLNFSFYNPRKNQLIKKENKMRSSELISKKHKEKPAEAQIISHIYLLRGGYIRPVGTGIYSLLTPAKRIQHKIERIIREEMDAIGGQEVQMPVVLPRELWDETGRYTSVDKALLRFKDRGNHDMILAMTHEEAVVALARTEVTSYKDYPFMIYQIQTKFRDEPRSRGGLIRVREFTMKDAYSFHASQEDLDEYYEKVAKAYHNIYRRAGVPEVVSIQSDNGMMGGKIAHEYQLITDAGEDKIIHCPKCKTYANSEVATATYAYEAEELQPLSEISTPNAKTIDEVAELLQIPEQKMAKAVFYTTEGGETFLALIRGDIEVNECKLQKVVKANFLPATDEAITKIGAVAGFAGGIGLKDVRIIADKSISNGFNFITGANKKDTHLKNFNLARDLPNAVVADIATAKDGDICPVCGAKMELKRGIEVGNIFKLGTFYTKSMNMTFTDEKGKEQTPIMGCYGIGVGRLIGSVIEARHDDFGPIWPLSIAPWQVQINAVGMDKEGIAPTAEKLYKDLTAAGIEVLFDDRNLSAGQQFAEADLTGIPLRFIVAPRSLAQGKIEYKIRGTDEGGLIDIATATRFAEDWLKAEMQKYK